MRTHILFGSPLALALAVVLHSNTTQAQLIAYEGFDYAVGSLLGGLNGGMGWNTAWIGSGNATNSQVVSGSFVYNDGFGNVVTTFGNRLRSTADGITDGLPGTPNGNSTQSPRRLLSYRGTNSTPSTTWISFMSLRTGAADAAPPSDGEGSILFNRAAGLQLFYNAVPGNTGQGSELLSVGRGTQTGETSLTLANDTWGMLYHGNAAFSKATTDDFTTATRANSTADFILMRIDHTGGAGTGPGALNDSASIWLNPRLDNESLLGVADLTLLPGDWGGGANEDRDLAFNIIRLFAGNYSGTSYGSIEVDEIKIGNTYGDVTLNPVPEPGVAALLGLGFLALVQRTRRK